jgi:flagellar operon protein
MVERINALRQLHQLGGLQQARAVQGAPAFEDVLKKQVEQAQSLKFSAHAQDRMAGRGITLSENDLRNLENAADSAASKGSREALLLMNDVGFIVNVRSRTVLTALDTAMLNDRVVTNIDSAVFVQGTGKA